MFFASDNSSGVPPQIMAALQRANDGYTTGYGTDDLTARATEMIRKVFEAPEAAVYLVATGTAANALAVSIRCPPWGAVFCHRNAHLSTDECGAPEFYSGGAKLLAVEGAHGKITPESLTTALDQVTQGDVHSPQRGMLSLTNVTEAGTIYTPVEVAALTAIAHANGLPCHMDGSRFANAIASTGATPARMTWQSGIDILSFGGTKNGCLGVEAVVIFDPAKAWEFELRRKRGGHLFSKHRFLAAQIEAYLQDDLWLDLAHNANKMAMWLAMGLVNMPGVSLLHPVEANIVFAQWPIGTHQRIKPLGAVYSPGRPTPTHETARLVASWSTTRKNVNAMLAAIAG